MPVLVIMIGMTHVYMYMRCKHINMQVSFSPSVISEEVECQNVEKGGERPKGILWGALTLVQGCMYRMASNPIVLGHSL